MLTDFWGIAMLVLDKILAIPDCEPDAIQMGLANKAWAVVKATGKTKDGKAASPSVLKQERKGVSQEDIEKASKGVIKGDKPLTAELAAKVRGAIVRGKADKGDRNNGRDDFGFVKPSLDGYFGDGVTSEDNRIAARRELAWQKGKKTKDPAVKYLTYDQLQKTHGSEDLNYKKNPRPVSVLVKEDGSQRFSITETSVPNLFLMTDRQQIFNKIATPKSRQVIKGKSPRDRRSADPTPDTAKNLGMAVTYNKQGDLSNTSAVAKVKKAISGVKGGKVVKGKSKRREQSIEKLREQKEYIENMISTKKSLSQDIPQAWLDKYSQVSAKLNPKKKANSVKESSKEAYSLPVYGHPENHGYVRVGGKDVRTGFIPFKVDKDSDMSWRIRDAEKLVSDLSTNHFSMDAIAQGHKKATAKQKKEAKSYIRSATARENLSMIKTLKDETIPELYRLDKEVGKLKKSARKQQVFTIDRKPVSV